MASDLAPFVDGLSLYGAIEPFLVLADFLQSRDDPWGELISLSCLRADDPAARDRRIAELQGELAPRLWPADDFLVRSWWRGFVSAVTVTDSEGPAWLGAQLERLLDAPGSMLCGELAFRDFELGDGNVDMLIGLGDRIRRMARVAFDGNRFSTAAIERLQTTFPHATFARQTDTFDDRGPRVLIKSWSDPPE